MVMVVVMLTFEVCGVLSFTESDGSEKREVSPPRCVGGLLRSSSKPREPRNPAIHFHLWLTSVDE